MMGVFRRMWLALLRCPKLSIFVVSSLLAMSLFMMSMNGCSRSVRIMSFLFGAGSSALAVGIVMYSPVLSFIHWSSLGSLIRCWRLILLRVGTSLKKR